MYYGVIGKPMEIAITDIFEVGQLVKSRMMKDGGKESAAPYGVDQIGVIIEIVDVSAEETDIRHVVKILWQEFGGVEDMPDWIAAEVLTPLPS